MLEKDNYNELTIATSENNNEIEKNLKRKRIKKNLIEMASLKSSNSTETKISILAAKTGISSAKFSKNNYLEIDFASSTQGLAYNIHDNLAGKIEPIVIVFKEEIEDNSNVNNENESNRNEKFLAYASFSFAFIIIMATFRCLHRALKRANLENKNSFKLLL